MFYFVKRVPPKIGVFPKLPLLSKLFSLSLEVIALKLYFYSKLWLLILE